MRGTTKLSTVRNNFLKLRGGKLISAEAYVLALIVLFVMHFVKNYSVPVSVVVAFIVAYVFPILIGMFQFLAWLAAVAFSLIWGILAFIIVGAVAHESVLVGLLAGIIVFAMSFWIHKHYSGLEFHSVRRSHRDQAIQITANEATRETVAFCPKCGRRIHSINGKCDICDK